MAKGFLAEVGCSLLSHGGKHPDLCYIFRRDEIWVKYCTYVGAMSVLGQKRTFAVQNVMSALPPKADICSALVHVRFVPIADIAEGFFRSYCRPALRNPSRNLLIGPLV